MPNRFNPIAGNSSQEAMIAQMNKNFSLLDQEAVTKVIKGTGGIDRSIQGRLPNDLGYGTILYDRSGTPSIYMASDDNGNPVFKVAKSGKDATTGADDDMVFNSAQNVLKVVKTDTTYVDVNWTAGDQTFETSIDHGLSNPPVVIAYTAYPTAPAGTYYAMPYYVLAYNSGTSLYSIAYLAKIRVDSTNVKFQVQTGSNVGNGTWPIHYYILQESAV